jgi:hypothetical protein
VLQRRIQHHLRVFRGCVLDAGTDDRLLQLIGPVGRRLDVARCPRSTASMTTLDCRGRGEVLFAHPDQVVQMEIDERIAASFEMNYAD